ALALAGALRPARRRSARPPQPPPPPARLRARPRAPRSPAGRPEPPAAPRSIAPGSYDPAVSIDHLCRDAHAQVVLTLLIARELAHRRVVFELDLGLEPLALGDGDGKSRALPGTVLAACRVVALHLDTEHVLSRGDRVLIDGRGA